MSPLIWFLIILAIIVIIIVVILLIVFLPKLKSAFTPTPISSPPTPSTTSITPFTPVTPATPVTPTTILTTCPSPGNTGMTIAGIPQTIIATTCTGSAGALSSQTVPIGIGQVFNSPNQAYTIQFQPIFIMETPIASGATGAWVGPYTIGSQGIPLNNNVYELQSNGQLIGLAPDPTNGATYEGIVNSTTGGVSPYTLSLGNDGNLLIWDVTGTIIWSNCITPNSNIPTNVCS